MLNCRIDKTANPYKKDPNRTVVSNVSSEDLILYLKTTNQQYWDFEFIAYLLYFISPTFNNILVSINGSNFTQQDYELIQNISEIITDSGEIGEFELGNLKININSLETFENDLMFIENSHNEKN